MMFQIVKNGLQGKKADIKSLKLSSDVYQVTFFYYGDYEKDFKNKSCDTGNLSMHCKESGNALPISLMGGKILVETMENPLMSTDEIAEFKNQLDIAYAAATELEAVIKEYFGIEGWK